VYEEPAGRGSLPPAERDPSEHGSCTDLHMIMHHYHNIDNTPCTVIPKSDVVSIRHPPGSASDGSEPCKMKLPLAGTTPMLLAPNFRCGILMLLGLGASDVGE
jgi:hypothetical protein